MIFPVFVLIGFILKDAECFETCNDFFLKMALNDILLDGTTCDRGFLSDMNSGLMIFGNIGLFCDRDFVVKSLIFTNSQLNWKRSITKHQKYCPSYASEYSHLECYDVWFSCGDYSLPLPPAYSNSRILDFLKIYDFAPV